MRRAGFIVGLLLLIFMNVNVVKAEVLNEYELQIINEAKKIYEVEGKLYHLDDVYINALTEYLSASNMDVTSEQKDKVIAKMYESLEQGVLEGYLIPVNESDKVLDEMVEVDKEVNDIVEEIIGTDILEEENINSDNGVVSDGISGNLDSASNNISNNSTDAEAGLKAGIKKSEVNAETATVVITDEGENPVLTLNTAIKNTGFSLYETIVLFTVLICFMLVSIFVTLKFRLFAHSNE